MLMTDRRDSFRLRGPHAIFVMRFLIFLLAFVFLQGAVLPKTLASEAGEDFAREASALEKQGLYSQAIEQYAEAIPMLLAEGNEELAAACSESTETLAIIMGTYPYTLANIKDLIRETYPEATDDQISEWTSSDSVHTWFYEGEVHYFDDTVANLPYRYLDLMFENEASQTTYEQLVADVLAIDAAQPTDGFAQYSKPATYRGIHTISMPREALPETGELRIWLPVPINTGPQTGVVIESVTPEEWLVLPPSINQDIGLAYFEVPLADLTDDLFIELSFVFTHYEQHVNVNPDLVGEYDRESALYRQYTSSFGNTEITAEIRGKAEEIAGGEPNPYYAARALHDYIVDNVAYCFMPHSTFYPRTDLTESDYVHRTQQGDCGAQSMYFSAMCRALGIPARSTGGWQLFAGEYGGHFWAEFYLPNYGWVPVDTSFGQMADFAETVSEEDRAAFKNFSFASQDSMRCVVQKDTDLPLIPAAEGMVLLPMALQMPAAEYSMPASDLTEIRIIEYWTLTCENLEGGE